LCSDGEAAIAPQPKRGPQEHIVNIHPGVRQHGAYSREHQPIEPHVAYKGYKENVSYEQERENFTKAICDGDCLSIVIHGLDMHWSYGQGISFSAPRFANEEKPFLNKLINILHLICICHNIGIAYHLIVQFGVQCTNNYVEDEYCVREILPTDGGSIACDFKCTFVEDGPVHDPVCMVKVECTVIGRLPPLAAPKEFDLNGNVSKRSGLHGIGYLSVVKSIEELMFRQCCTDCQVAARGMSPRIITPLCHIGKV
jgi:hypothetical protein